MGSGHDPTVDSFPTYAALTQTQGWHHDATTLVELKAVQIDPAAQRYTEGALLGVGGMGKVLLAHDARIGREVAVKQLHTDRELAPDERVRFLREARVQGQLEHPSIVPVYDIDQRADGTTFFTMAPRPRPDCTRSSTICVPAKLRRVRATRSVSCSPRSRRSA